MATLLIELAGAQQAWGSRSRFASRATELAPTKSGVVGLLAAALGLGRTAPLDRFDPIRFGVRIDQPGRVERDFQTTRSLDGQTSFPLSERWYLADAVFLAGVEAPDAELDAYRSALRRPFFPLFLGRRAFPPDGPVWTEIVDRPVEAALAEAAWRARPHHVRRTTGATVTLDVVFDTPPGEVGDETRQDVPQSFDPRRRRHGIRDVTLDRVTLSRPGESPGPGAPPASGPPRRGSGGRTSSILGSPTAHDPEALLSDEEV